MSSTTNDSKAGEAQPLLPTKTETTKGDDNDTHPTILNDAYDTVILGIPIFFSMLSWVGMKTTDSALLGHVSSQALSAAALSDLVRVTTYRGLRGIRLFCLLPMFSYCCLFPHYF